MGSQAKISQVTDLLRMMVRCDTVNSALSRRPQSEAVLVDKLDTLAQSWQLATKRMAVEGQADNLLVTVKVASDRPWLLFDSHLDTVATEGMTIDPFGGEVEDGKLYGRGACDTKGTGAAMLWALRQYAASDDSTQSNNIALLFSVDEEVGMTGISSFAENNLPELDFRPVGAIIGEPTLHQPVIAHNGCVRAEIATRGVAAHSSVPGAGKSAISTMVEVVRVIESEYIPSVLAIDRLTGSAACSINQIHGGSSPNTIPDTCRIVLDRRIVPAEKVEDILPAIDRALESLVEQCPDLQYEIRLLAAHPPLNYDQKAKLLGEIQTILVSHSLPPRPLGAPFATNASYLNSTGIPTVIIGPGDPIKAHTKDEWISLDQLHLGVQIYLAMMQQSID